jgi:formylglycine-generating enzyme required for sulfatase activity
MRRLLPDGRLTTDIESYVAMWTDLAAPLCNATGWTLLAYDPGFRFDNKGQSVCLSTQDVRDIVRALNAPLAVLDSGIRWVRIPAGSVMTQDRRVLTVERDFELAATLTTQTQYEQVMGNNPSRFQGAEHPVERVSAFDADNFAEKIGARLPTEVEWEYACLAGKSDDPYGLLEDVAWHRKNSANQTHPVGLKRPNAWGLYDMLGNVWEWTSTEEDDLRVNRGGGWSSYDAALVRAAVRNGLGPSFRSSILGFRCARDKGKDK